MSIKTVVIVVVAALAITVVGNLIAAKITKSENSNA